MFWQGERLTLIGKWHTGRIPTGSSLVGMSLDKETFTRHLPRCQNAQEYLPISNNIRIPSVQYAKLFYEYEKTLINNIYIF